MVGLLPLCAVTVFSGELREKYPGLMQGIARYLDARPELVDIIHDPGKVGYSGRRRGAILNEGKLRRVLARMLDESEFLGAHGIRALSRYHADHPYVMHAGGQEYRVSYVPGESDTGMFGGNSNWRGPVWFPMNLVILRALLELHRYYGDELRVECPTGSGVEMNLFAVATEIVKRLVATFTRAGDGRRPVYGGTTKFQTDPHWRDLILFHEYFNGDDGAGLGASHQTGWTALVAKLLQQSGE
jgi:hypothetical protein